MPLLATDAVVLHVLDYSETSRILRLATREAGVVSVLARGARRSRSRFGSALDLFAEGVAQLSIRPNRDLHTLSGFDVMRSHPALAADLERFAAGSALAELVLRFGGAEEGGGAFDALVVGLADIAGAEAVDAREAGLAAAWHLIAELGFAPAFRECASCHATLDAQPSLTFSNAAGGLLCARCMSTHAPGRSLDVAVRRRIAGWCAGERMSGDALEPLAGRAHQRLLREFLAHHLLDGRPLRAFDAWERGTLRDA